MRRRRGPGSPAGFRANLRADMPFGRKLLTTMRNLSTRFRGQTCCGHPGEPGC